MYLRFALDSLCGQEMILTSSCLYFPSVGVIGMCHHAQFSACWRNQTRRFVHARQALHQQRYTPSSICPAVWIVGLRGEGRWGRCALCAVCSSREAAGSLGTRSLPGLVVSTHLGTLFVFEAQVHVFCLHAPHSGYFVSPRGQYGLASFTTGKNWA